MPGPPRSAGLTQSGSTFQRHRFEWRASSTPSSGSSRLTRKRFRSIPTSFDAVVNGFGMCHVPNPDIALGEAFRVLKRGGRVAFTVWDTPERAVGLGAIYAAVRAHGSMDVGLPAGPNFFLFSNPEQSTRALLSAGFASPSCRQVPQVWRISDPDKVLQVIAEGSVRAAATLRAQSPSAREAIKAALRETIAAYKRGDSFRRTDARHTRHSCQAMTVTPNHTFERTARQRRGYPHGFAARRPLNVAVRPQQASTQPSHIGQ